MLLVPVLFVAGVLFGYFVALPRAVGFLQNFNTDKFDILIQAQDYYKFVVLFLALMGLIFQIPVGVLALTRAGIVNARILWQRQGYVILGISIVAAVATPTPDPVTMIVTMLPLDPAVRAEHRTRVHLPAQGRDDHGPLGRLVGRARARGRRAAAGRGGCDSWRHRGPRTRILSRMLFDLRGRGRRRTVQVIYLGLAVLMGGGLVLFGIGGATPGGLFDAVSGNSSSTWLLALRPARQDVHAAGHGEPEERGGLGGAREGARPAGLRDGLRPGDRPVHRRRASPGSTGPRRPGSATSR